MTLESPAHRLDSRVGVGLMIRARIMIRQSEARGLIPATLGLLYMLVFLTMNMLSGSNTPLESMPPWLATAMQASPSTHFVSFAQSILYRGAGIDVVWPEFLAVAGIGGLFFSLAILRFRSIASQAM